MVTVELGKCFDRTFKSNSVPLKPLPLTLLMVFSASNKLRNIAIEALFIIKYNLSHKNKKNGLGW